MESLIIEEKDRRLESALTLIFMLLYQIQDPNFREQEVVLAFNLGGGESITEKIKYFFKDNSTTAFTQVANLLTSIGLKFIHN